LKIKESDMMNVILVIIVVVIIISGLATLSGPSALTIFYHPSLS